MKTTSYVYGIESGRIYGEYGNSLTATKAYRKALGIDDGYVPAPEWAGGLDEDLGLIADMRFGKAGFKLMRTFRSLRRRLSNVPVTTKKSRNGDYRVEVSLWGVIRLVAAWAWLVSGVAALVAAFAIAPAPANIALAFYGAAPVIVAAKELVA